MCSSDLACPADIVTAGGTVCNAGSGDLCDPDEVCSGTADVACPADRVASATTVCNAGSGDLCDPDELCSGTAGVACPADTVASATTVCNAGSGDVCDPDELCSGTAGVACPADIVTAGGTVCNAGSGDLCDPDEVCSGTADAACPADVIAVADTVCRGAADDCDVAELCDGAGSCPNDGFAAAGNACGDPSDTACDNSDSCDGSGSCLANFELATTECRSSTGQCDVAELCDGTGGCPADALAAAGTPCGDRSDTSCDKPDSCDASGSCLVNFEPVTTECRSAIGGCDVAELCNGAGSCPEDAFVAAATVCRPLAGGCDVAESCTGSAAACPPDAFRGPGSACRPASGVCDVADACTGASAACADGLVPAGTVCRPDTGTCDVAEACTGNSVACPPDASIRVDFDGAAAPDAFANATPLTVQYAALGVVWQGTGAVLDEAALPGLAGQSPPNFAAYADGEPLLGGTSGSFDAIDLTCPAKEVSFLVGADSTATFVAAAFDTIGNRLDDFGVQIDPDLRQVTLRAVNGLITRVEYETFALGQGEPVPAFAVDSLFVPEPGALLGPLAALTALGLVTARRAKQ